MSCNEDKYLDRAMFRLIVAGSDRVVKAPEPGLAERLTPAGQHPVGPHVEWPERGVGGVDGAASADDEEGDDEGRADEEADEDRDDEEDDDEDCDDEDCDDEDVAAPQASRGSLFVGPRRAVYLDGIPRSRWRVPAGSVALFDRRRWAVEPGGCVLCLEAEDPAVFTLAAEDDARFLCTVHGDLEELPYVVRRTSETTLGTARRQAEDGFEDSLLFPVAMSAQERAELVDRILDECQSRQEDEGPLPGDE
jgi:hypothetical protein